jgi:hypothetical protein
VVLVDARLNDRVMAARRQLARLLGGCRADVRHGHLPDDDSRVNGPDDFIAAYGDAALWKVINSAVADDLKRTKKGDGIANDLDNIRLAFQSCACGSSLTSSRT